jgi:hypothetical protein
MPKHNYGLGNDRIAEHCERHLPEALNRILGNSSILSNPLSRSAGVSNEARARTTVIPFPCFSVEAGADAIIFCRHL